uniref:Uncharacterized protein n=1 Tax=Arundo donax TaxID=35708 RepID=A0A0A8Y983_ARUDO
MFKKALFVMVLASFCTSDQTYCPCTTKRGSSNILKMDRGLLNENCC